MPLDFSGVTEREPLVGGRPAVPLVDPTVVEKEREFYDTVDTIRGVAGAATKAVYDLYDTGNDLMNLVRDTAIQVPGYQEMVDASPEDALIRYIETETTAGRITQDFGSFIVGLIGVGKFTRGAKLFGTMKDATKARKFSKAMVDGAITDFVVMNPEAPRLADLVPKELRPAFVDYLAYNDGEQDEAALEARLKNTIEGGIFGASATAFAEIAAKGWQTAKASLKAGAKTGAENDRLANELYGFHEVTSKTRLTVQSPEITRTLPQLDEIAETGKATRKAALIDVDAQVVKALDVELAEASKLGVDEFARVVDRAIRLHRFRDPETRLQYFANTMRRLEEVYDKEAIAAAKAGNATYEENLLESTKAILKHSLANPRGAIAVYQRTGHGVTKLAAQVNIANQLLQKNADELADAAMFLLKNPDDLKGAQAMFDLAENHLVTLPLFHSPKSMAGKGLKAARLDETLTTAFRTRNPEVQAERWQGLRDLIDQGRVGTTDEILEAARQFARKTLKSRGDLPRLENDLLKRTPKFLEKLMQFRVINMLSGPTTQAVNFASAGTRVLVEDFLEGGMAVAWDATVGAKRFGKIAGSEGVTMRGYVAHNVGLLKGVEAFVGGLRESAEKAGGWRAAIKKGTLIDNASIEAYTRAEMENLPNILRMDPQTATLKPMAHVFNAYSSLAHTMVFGTMNLSDSLVKSSRFHGLAWGRAVETAVAKGLQGAEYDHFVSNTVKLLERYAKDRGAVKEYLRVVMKDEEAVDATLRSLGRMYDDALQHARVGTFQQDLTMAPLKKLEDLLNMDHAGARLVKMFAAPFFRTPMNIIDFVIERSPGLNLLTKQYRDDFLGKNGREAAARSLAKMTMGLSLYGTAAYLVSTGLITGGHKAKHRALLGESGYPEYSIFIPQDGLFVSYNRTDPFGLFLGVVADLGEASNALDNQEYDKMVNSVILAASNNLVNKTYMKGLSDLVNVFKDPERFREGFVKGQVRTFSPLSGAQRGIDAIFDRSFEETPDLIMTDIDSAITSALSVAFKDLPGRQLPKKTNIFGNDIARPEGHLYTVMELSGLRPVKESDSLAMREMARLKYYPQTDNKRLYGDAMMTPEQSRRYREILKSETGIEADLNRAIESPGYIDLGNRRQYAEQARILKSISRAHQAAAKRILLLKDDTAYAAVVAERQKEELHALRASSGDFHKRILESREARGIQEIIQQERPTDTGE